MRHLEARVRRPPSEHRDHVAPVRRPRAFARRPLASERRLELPVRQPEVRDWRSLVDVRHLETDDRRDVSPVLAAWIGAPTIEARASLAIDRDVVVDAIRDGAVEGAVDQTSRGVDQCCHRRAGRIDRHIFSRSAINGRDIASWRRMLATLQPSHSSYRDDAPTKDEMLAVLADERAPVERRIAVALALGNDSETAEAVHGAIAKSGDRHVRVALREAADGDLTDAQLEGAVKASAQRRDKDDE